MMKPMKEFTVIVIAAFYMIGLFACNQTNSKATSYRASIKRDDGLPIVFNIQEKIKGDSIQWIITNAGEQLLVEEIEVKKSNPINDSFSKTISFGLNDKIAFEKQLFGGSSEDLNRVISQLSTFDTFDEAENFIEDMVKPDYNNWEGKDDYVARFMEIVEKKFA